MKNGARILRGQLQRHRLPVGSGGAMWAEDGKFDALPNVHVAAQTPTGRQTPTCVRFPDGWKIVDNTCSLDGRMGSTPWTAM